MHVCVSEEDTCAYEGNINGKNLHFALVGSCQCCLLT